MNPQGNRTRLAAVLVAVAAALALVALPGLAAAHHGHDGPADAGTIQSFDQETGALAIDLADGGSVSGLVTPRTHIHCDNGRHQGRHGLRHRLRGHGATAPGHSENPGKGAEHSARCTTDDLVTGATVKFADLVLVDGKAIFKLVALPKPSAPEPVAPPSS